MIFKPTQNIILRDGVYRGKLGGKTVCIRQSDKNIRFDVDHDSGDVMVSVTIVVKNGIVTVKNAYGLGSVIKKLKK